MKMTCNMLKMLVLFTILGSSVATTVRAAELCTGLANCTTTMTAGVNNCSHMLTFGASTITNINTFPTGAPAQGCVASTAMAGAPAMATFRASQLTTATPAGSCGFSIMVFSAGTVTHTCTINGQDGLPVELMEFSVGEQ